MVCRDCGSKLEDVVGPPFRKELWHHGNVPDGGASSLFSAVLQHPKCNIAGSPLVLILGLVLNPIAK